MLTQEDMTVPTREHDASLHLPVIIRLIMGFAYAALSNFMLCFQIGRRPHRAGGAPISVSQQYG